LWLSLIVLILLTFPFDTIVSAQIAAPDLWAEGWGWRGKVVDTILQHASRVLPISWWQWLLGAFVLVAGVNLAATLGWFRWLRQWFIDVSYAGPIAVAHAKLLPQGDALAVLKRSAALLQDEHAKREFELENLRAQEARAPDGKAEVEVMLAPGKSRKITSDSFAEGVLAPRLRMLAREASAIAARLPNDDPAALALLQRVARTSPEAAFEVARRVGRINPSEAHAQLERHADQPGWLLRRRVRRALAEGEGNEPRVQRMPSARTVDLRARFTLHAGRSCGSQWPQQAAVAYSSPSRATPTWTNPSSPTLLRASSISSCA
jgi:hypothetical protein